MNRLIAFLFLTPLFFILVPLMAQSTERLIFSGFNEILVGNPIDKPLTFKSLIAKHTLRNIVHVSRANKVISLVALGEKDTSDGLVLFLFDLGTQNLKRIQQIPGLVAAKLSPSTKLVALTICAANGCAIDVLDLSSNYRFALVDQQVEVDSVSWDSASDKIAFSSKDGLIHILEWKSKVEVGNFKGSSPSWSPDGARILFLKDKALFAYDVKTRQESKLYKRRFWQNAIMEEIYWQANAAAVAFNVAAGMGGYEFECLLLDVATGKIKSIYSGPYRCGPWVE